MALDLIEFDPRTVDRDAQILALDRADCEESLYRFLKAGWRYIDPAVFKDSWAIEAICEHLQAIVDGDIQRLLINCPPRIGKSGSVSVALPAFTWAQRFNSPTSGPGVPFLFASYDDDLSLRDSVKCRFLIESPWYQARWGDRFMLVSDQNTKRRFKNDHGGERLITSILGGVTGEGGNCFVGGTMVSTPSGRVPIENLRAGDPVLSFDMSQGKVVKSRVLVALKRKARDLCTVREVSGHRFRCTSDHPIYSPGLGFVSASEMGAADRVLVAGCAVDKQADRNVATSDMRQLRRETEEAPIRAAQGVETRKQGLLLRCQLPRRTSCVEEFQALREVRGAGEATRAFLSKLQTGARQLVGKIPTGLRNLWEGISALWLRQTILLKDVRWSCPFIADDGFWKLEVQESWPRTVFDSISKDASNSFGTGSTLLHELRRAGTNVSAQKSADNATSASYRRSSVQQSARESDYALRKLSSDTSLWRHSHIAEVVRDRDAEDWVYDIQVETHGNFFAESILVHNCIVIDDPNSSREIQSEAALQKVIEWWVTAMPSRANDQETCAWIVIQQRMAENDLTGHILETNADGWTHLCLPARYEPERSYHTVIGWKDPRTEPDELLWPERLSEPTLKRLEKEMGPYGFAGQYQQRPEPKGGGIIKREWWKLWDRETWPEMDFVLACLDTAYTEETMNDPSGMIIWGVFSSDAKVEQPSAIVDANGQPFDRDMMRAKRIQLGETFSEFAPKVMCIYAWTDRLELHPLVEKVAQLCIKFKVDLLKIENKASGHSVAQEIQRLYSREKFGVQLFDPKSQDKTARLYSVQHLFAEGIVWAPDRPWMEKVITQVGQHPKGKHDEYVDCTSMGLRSLRDMGLLTRQPEREADIEAEKEYRGRQEPLYAV